MIKEVCIVCRGVGEYTGYDNRRIDQNYGRVFQLFDYKSPVGKGGPVFYICDWLVLLWDLKNLKETPTPSIKLSRPNRVQRLVDLIKEYLNVDTTKLTLIGVSHGSLLMQAAILRLQVELPVELFKKFNTIIHFYTLGSPRHPLPQILIRKHTLYTPNQDIQKQIEWVSGHPLLNFYHIDDKILPTKALNIWGTTRHPFMKNRRMTQIVPEKNSITFKHYKFYPDTNIVFHTDNEANKIFGKEPKWSAADYHANLYLLYPLYSDFTLYWLNTIHLPSRFFQMNTDATSHIAYNLAPYRKVINNHICVIIEKGVIDITSEETNEETKTCEQVIKTKSRRKSAPKAPSSAR